METAARPSPLTTATFAYAATAVIVLAVLPHLQAPLERFGAPNHGAVLLGASPSTGIVWGWDSGVFSPPPARP